MANNKVVQTKGNKDFYESVIFAIYLPLSLITYAINYLAYWITNWIYKG